MTAGLVEWSVRNSSSMIGRRREERREGREGREGRDEMTLFRDAHYHSYPHTHTHTHTRTHTHTHKHTQLLTSNS